jgi:hypothetical protein
MLIRRWHRCAVAVAVIAALGAPASAGAASPAGRREAARHATRGRGHRHRTAGRGGAKPAPPTSPPPTAPSPTARWDFAGTVQGVDAQAGTVDIAVAEAPNDHAAVGTDQRFSVSAATTIAVADVNGDGVENLADVHVGDRAVAFILAPSSAPAAGTTLAAVALYDETSPPPKPAPPAPTPPSSPTPPTPPASTYWAFDGTVASVNPGAGTVVVTIGQVYGAPSSYVGEQQQFTVTSSTRYKVADVNGDGAHNLADVSVGDSVGVYVLAPDPAPAAGSPLAAIEVSDFAKPPTSASSTSSTATPPPVGAS